MPEEDLSNRFEMLTIKLEQRIMDMGEDLNRKKVTALAESMAHLVVDEVLTLVEYNTKCSIAELARLHVDIDERDIELEQAKSSLQELEHDNYKLTLEIDRRR